MKITSVVWLAGLVITFDLGKASKRRRNQSEPNENEEHFFASV